MIFFPAVELLDRLAIARVKWRRTAANADELAWYEQQAQQLHLDDGSAAVMRELESIHEEIWDLEKELKAGKEQQLPLEEIGRRAIVIRDHNNLRIRCKNSLAASVGCLVREIKRDHLSE